MVKIFEKVFKTLHMIIFYAHFKTLPSFHLQYKNFSLFVFVFTRYTFLKNQFLYFCFCTLNTKKSLERKIKKHVADHIIASLFFKVFLKVKISIPFKGMTSIKKCL